MKRPHGVAPGWLAAALACGLLLATLLWLPARWFAPALPAGIACAKWSGSLWSGQCSGLAIDGSRSGDLRWTLEVHANSLTLPVRLVWVLGDSNAQATLRLRLGGLVALRPHTALQGAEAIDLDLSLQTLRNALPADLRLGPLAALEGRLLTRGFTLTLSGDQTLQAEGELRLNAVRLLRADLPLGDFVATFTSAAGQPARGVVRDLGGNLRLGGTIDFAPARAYEAVFRVEARSPAAAQALGIATPFELKLDGRF